MPVQPSVQRANLQSPEDVRGPLVRVRVGQARWRLLKASVDHILGPDVPDWFAPEDDSRAQGVKRGEGRCTWRVTLGDRTIFAKVADLSAGGFGQRLRLWLGMTAAQREWRTSREAEGRGVPVARCVGIGLRGGRRPRTVLLSAGIHGAVNLSDAWAERAVKPGSRQRPGEAVVNAVAGLYAAAHDRGFVHRDGHPRNVLIHADRVGELSAVFVDVAGAALSSRAAPYSRVVRSLAQLDHAFRPVTTRTERLRFLHRYLRQSKKLRERSTERRLERRLIAAIADAEKVHAATLARQRDRRLRRSSKYFARLRLEGGWQAGVVLQVERRHVFPEPTVADRTTEQWRAILGPLLSRAHDREEARRILSREGLSLEIGRPEGRLKSLDWTLRGSPHRRAFVHCHRLRHRDLDGGLVLAWAERHNRAGLIDTALLMHPAREEAI